MRRTRFHAWPCSIARTVDLLGDWWTPLVLREAFYGVRRFDDFQEGLGVARNILTERLARLTDEGVLRKVPYCEKPPRFEYRLTDKGRGLFGVMMALMQWGDEWLAGDEGPPIELLNVETGQLVRPQVVDAVTGQPLDPRVLRPRVGTGFPKRLLKHPAVKKRFGL